MTGYAAEGKVLANHTHVNCVGGLHTADYVELASFGPGSEALKGFVLNTDLFDVKVEAAQLTGATPGVPEMLTGMNRRLVSCQL